MHTHTQTYMTQFASITHLHEYFHPSNYLSITANDVNSGVLLDIVESPHAPAAQPSVLAMKQSLINCRQHEAFLKVLMVS